MSFIHILFQRNTLHVFFEKICKKYRKKAWNLIFPSEMHVSPISPRKLLEEILNFVQKKMSETTPCGQAGRVKISWTSDTHDNSQQGTPNFRTFLSQSGIVRVF